MDRVGYSSTTRWNVIARRVCAAVSLLAICCLIYLTAFAAAGQTADRAPVSLDEVKLKAGQYRWSLDEMSDEPIVIVVSLAAQRAYVYQSGVLVGVTTISSGKRGHETPRGMFSILQKKRFHRSNLYDDAPMPFMLRLTWGGLAMHGGVLPGRPASHGCIRLPQGFARKLFAIASYDTLVFVTDHDTAPVTTAVHRDEIRQPEVVPLDPVANDPEPEDGSSESDDWGWGP